MNICLARRALARAGRRPPQRGLSGTRANRRLGAWLAGVALLSGCASFSSDGGFDRVGELTRERVGAVPTYQRTDSDVQRARARADELIRQEPLRVETAVELALLNNRGLQASFSALGVAEAERVRAGRLGNPLLSFGRLREGAGVIEIERSIVFNVLNLLMLPVAADLEQRRFEQAQLAAAQDAVSLAGEVRRAYFSAVAAQELVRYQRQVKDAAEASNELARRMVQAGNFPKLTQMREQAFYADSLAQLARAQHRATVDRERLARLLGLAGSQVNFALPDRLPDLPDAPSELKDAEQTALAQRLDVLMAKRSAEHTARALGLTRATRFINVLELGYQNKSATGEPRANGYEIELELPLFDAGSTRAARAEAVYMQSVHRAAEVAVNAQSEVRDSYAAYRTAYDLARHYRDEVVPLKKRISEETLLRYNGMLIGVFELLADARAQVAGVTGYVEALRDFWIADTHFQAARTGSSRDARSGLPLLTSTGGATADVAGH